MTKSTTKPAAEGEVERAMAEVERLNSKELGMAMLYRQKAAELAGVRAERGDQLLDAEDPKVAARQIGRRVNELLEELESLADAVRSARKRRLAAIPAVFKAQADEAERAAVQLEAEAATLEASSQKLRRELETATDCAWSPTPPTSPDHRLIGGGGGRILYVRVPNYERRRMAALGKRDESRQHRLKKPLQSGSLTANGFDELLAAVFSDPLRGGPPIDSIRTWAEQAVEKERRRRGARISGDDLTPLDTPMRMHLEWRNATIDAAQSWIVQSGAAEGPVEFNSDALDEPGDAGQRASA